MPLQNQLSQLEQQLWKEQGRITESLRAQEELLEYVEHLDCRLAEKVTIIVKLRCRLDELQSRNAIFEAGQVSEATVVQRELVKNRAVSKDVRQIIFQKHANAHVKRQLTAFQKDIVQACLTANVRHLDTPGVINPDRGLQKNLLDGKTKL